jgi:hypothetical protein
MSAISDSRKARHEIANWGYATPVVCPHLRSPLAGLVSGASSMFDPFRSSLPSVYHYWPSGMADVIALRSDWGIYRMDFQYVHQRKLHAANRQQELSLFDPKDLGS